jgi:hypothetical protein
MDETLEFRQARHTPLIEPSMSNPRTNRLARDEDR